MTFYVTKTKGGGDFPTPPSGFQRAVCCQVIDRGMMSDKFKGKDVRKLLIVWQLEAKEDSGRRFQVHKWYNFSLHEKATLCVDIEGWLSKELPVGEKYEPSWFKRTLEGKNCTLRIKVDPKDGGGEKATVKTIVPPRDGEENVLSPEDFSPRFEPDLGEDGYPTEEFP
jgi:hypothetical protein